jgi:hypothetical protein
MTHYFRTEEEVRDFYEKNDIPYCNEAIRNANDEKDYFAPFAEIEGCEVLYCTDAESWHNLKICINWKGTAMRVNPNFDEKNKMFLLCEDMNWMGIERIYHEYNDCPNKIGKPTATKLDQWRDYLLKQRKEDEDYRERKFACILATIDDVCKAFPEAKEVKWENGYWTFEKDSNGFVYTVQIGTSGRIFEKLDKSYSLQDYICTNAERAARLMDNGMKWAEKKEFHEAYEAKSAAWKEKINRFIGHRPNFNN